MKSLKHFQTAIQFCVEPCELGSLWRRMEEKNSDLKALYFSNTSYGVSIAVFGCDDFGSHDFSKTPRMPHDESRPEL